MVSAEEKGEHLFQYDNASETNATEAVRVRSNRVSGGALDPTDFSTLTYRPIVNSSAWVDEGGYIKWAFKNDGADTVESEESSLMLPIVLKRKRDGHMIFRYLSSNDLDSFTRAGTDDVVGSITSHVPLGKYTVPQGFMAKIDSREILHAYVGDDTA